MLSTTARNTFDNAIETANIQMDTFRWLTRNRFEIVISGKLCSGYVHTLTEQGIKDAIATTLRNFCAAAVVAAA